MRGNYVLLMVAVTFLASSKIASASSSALFKAMAAEAVHSINIEVTRELRKKTATVPADDEERVADEKAIDAKILDKIVSDHAYAKQVFRSWLQNGQTKEDIENRLKTQGLLDKYGKVVTQYAQYLTILEERSAQSGCMMVDCGNAQHLHRQ